MFCRAARSHVAWDHSMPTICGRRKRRFPMKRFVLVVFALAAVGMFSACKKDKKKDAEPADPAAKTTDPAGADMAKPGDKPADPAATDPAGATVTPAGATDPAAAGATTADSTGVP